MKKRWIKTYLLFSSILFISVCLITTLLFSSDSINLSSEKQAFESIYTKSDIDFVIPSPSFEQTSELENDGNSYIDKAVPFYSFSTNVSLNNKTYKLPIVILDDVAKVEYSPYCNNRIVKGKGFNNNYEAIIDLSLAKENKIHIGDTLVLQLGDSLRTFNICGMSEDNSLSINPTICLLIPNDVSKQINDDFRYSGAYVKSTNEDLCYSFLCNSYKPLGRKKSLDDFNGDVVAYEKHVETFNNTNWAPEITSLRKNYDTLSVKYSNVDSKVISNLIISCSMILVVTLGYNLLILLLPTERRFFSEMLAKKNLKTTNLKQYYCLGNAFELALSLLLLLLIPLLTISFKGVSHLTNVFMIVFCPSIVLCVSEIISVALELLLLSKKLYK